MVNSVPRVNEQQLILEIHHHARSIVICIKQDSNFDIHYTTYSGDSILYYITGKQQSSQIQE